MCTRTVSESAAVFRSANFRDWDSPRFPSRKRSTPPRFFEWGGIDSSQEEFDPKAHDNGLHFLFFRNLSLSFFPSIQRRPIQCEMSERDCCRCQTLLIFCIRGSFFPLSVWVVVYHSIIPFLTDQTAQSCVFYLKKLTFPSFLFTLAPFAFCSSNNSPNLIRPRRLPAASPLKKKLFLTPSWNNTPYSGRKGGGITV